MHAWAALKPADIVQAARALRELVAGAKADDQAEPVVSTDESPDDRVLPQESTAAE